ncbi:MAG: tetraacyldisaccharide 4'-kinase, partial [Eudoraea sp.]|nr:tetraacyldisaccharide 4'-kinase [Eudoraea sp.]
RWTQDFNHLAFPDHHIFTEEEIAKLNTCDLVVTTEKDYMRLKGQLGNLYYLGVSHEFLGSDDSRLLGSLRKL